MYSVFAIPNIGLSIGGGMMIDQMGGRWGVLYLFIKRFSHFHLCLHYHNY